MLTTRKGDLGVSGKVARRAKTRKRRWVKRAERREQQERTQAVIDRAIAGIVGPAIEQALQDEVTRLVGRAKGERRDLADDTVVEARCNRCGTQQRNQFSRAGSYSRGLLTFEVWTTVRVPRVSCVCGGMVDVEFVHLVPSGRRWFDLEERARELAGLCLSLHDSVGVLAWRNGQPLAPTTINQIVNETALLRPAFAAEPFARVPAVVLLDGIWLKVLEPTGETYRDKQGRQRERQKKRTFPVLVAYGLDPVTGERWLVDWDRGAAEDHASWQRFLDRLEERGLLAERGLELVIHDGGSGLAAALGTVYFGPDVEYQRCVFHKLKNVRQAVVGDASKGRKERQKRRPAVLTEAAAVYQELDAAGSHQRLAAFGTHWQETEPEAVATFERNFEQTLTYLRVRDRALQRGLIYRLDCLRTTSPLERVNRCFRQKARQVAIFHAQTGVTAALELIIYRRHLTTQGSDPWTQLLEEALATA